MVVNRFSLVDWSVLMDDFKKMSAIYFQLDLNPISIILPAFPEEKLQSPLLYDKMHYLILEDYVKLIRKFLFPFS